MAALLNADVERSSSWVKNIEAPNRRSLTDVTLKDLFHYFPPTYNGERKSYSVLRFFSKFSIRYLTNLGT